MYSGGLVRKGDLTTGDEIFAMLVRREGALLGVRFDGPVTEWRELVEVLRWRVGVADRCSVGVEDRDRESSLAREGLRDGIRGLGAGEVLLTAGLNGDRALGVRGEFVAGEVERDSCLNECDRSLSALVGVFNVEWRRDGALSNGEAIAAAQIAWIDSEGVMRVDARNSSVGKTKERKREGKKKKATEGKGIEV